MITFALCLMIGKAYWWRTSPKCEARLGYYLVIDPMHFGNGPTLGLSANIILISR
jgi:hypothetical protein